MAELNQNGKQQDFYLFPPDGLWSTDPIFRKSGSSYFYYQTDHLGTPQQMIDGAGSVVHSRELRAFGEVAQSGIEDRWRFPGQLHSQETGLYYNYHRDYAPALGRYVQSDPIGHRGGMNFYRYVSAQPIVRADPRGLFAIDPGCFPDCEDENYEDKVFEIVGSIMSWCARIDLLIKDSRMAECMKNRCQNGRIVCTGFIAWTHCRGDIYQSGMAIGSWSRITLCADNIETHNKEVEDLGIVITEYGATVLHEFAHTCGWRGEDGYGVPYPHGEPEKPWYIRMWGL